MVPIGSFEGNPDTFRFQSEVDRVPPPPRTPTPRARRLLFKYAGSQKVMLVLGLAFLLIGTLFSVIFGRALPGQIALLISSERVPVTVTEAEVLRNTTINGHHPVRIHFEYEVDGARHESSSSTIDGAVNARVQIALGADGPQPLAERPTSDTDALPTAFFAEVSTIRPEWAQLEGTNYGVFPPWTAFVFLFPTIGLIVFVLAVRSNRREIRAFTRGKPTSGQVVSAGLNRSYTINNRHPYEVRWEFSIDGTTYEGKLSSMKMTALADMHEGSDVVVLYDPNNPKVNTVFLE